jgi:hypothetical protein
MDHATRALMTRRKDYLQAMTALMMIGNWNKKTPSKKRKATDISTKEMKKKASRNSGAKGSAAKGSTSNDKKKGGAKKSGARKTSKEDSSGNK